MSTTPRPGPPLRIRLPPVAPRMRNYLSTEAGGAVLLLVATIGALVWANSAWSQSYTDLWHTTAGFKLGDFTLELDLHGWVNDAIMAIFFLVIGLEINSEFSSGDMSDFRRAGAPIMGAIGGLAVPALIYFAFNFGTEAAHGWGLVTSTDTAFLVGILALFGPACPDKLRLFLLTLAVVDDIGAIGIMAVFYTDDMWIPGLVIAVVLVAVLFAFRWLGVWRLGPYVIVGLGLWLAVYESGVHATLAGVAVGILVPSMPPPQGEVDAVRKYTRRLQADPTAERGYHAQLAAQAAIPAADRLQRALHPWSAYLVVPLFGLANAGVVMDAETLRTAMTSSVTIGVMVALVVGNTVGIFGVSFIGLRLGWGELPGRVRYGHLLGGAMLAGIGFTISLFIAELAFDDPKLVEQAKIGILAGSLIAAVLGALTLRFFGDRLPLCTPEDDDQPPPALPPLPWKAPESA